VTIQLYDDYPTVKHDCGYIDLSREVHITGDISHERSSFYILLSINNTLCVDTFGYYSVNNDPIRLVIFVEAYRQRQIIDQMIIEV